MMPSNSAERPFVTVKVESTREGFEALLRQEGLIEQSYTPEGVTWSNLMQAIRDALGATSAFSGRHPLSEAQLDRVARGVMSNQEGAAFCEAVRDLDADRLRLREALCRVREAKLVTPDAAWVGESPYLIACAALNYERQEQRDA